MSAKSKLLQLLFLFSVITSAQAQFKWAMIGVNGLTCSACTRSVEMSIRKLSFVKNVEMNLENTEGKINFEDNADVDFSLLAKAVVNAGFSVRYLKAAGNFTNQNVKNGLCLSYEKYNLQFVNATEKKLNGEVLLNFLGNTFQTKAEANKIKGLLLPVCADKSKKVYFVRP